MADDVPKITLSNELAGDMVEVEIRCKKCAMRQPVFGISIPAGSVMSDPRFTCVYCGAFNDGRGSWEAVEEDGELRATFRDMSLAELIRVRDLLTQMHRGGGSDPEAEADLKEAAPGLWGWFKRQRPEVQVAAVAAALMAVQILVSHLDATGNTTPSPVVTNTVVVQLEGGEVDPTQLPRRGPCWCGSGKRYKNCHGRDSAPGR